MGTYNPYFENNIEHQRCPFCGEERPLDWFGRRPLKLHIRSVRTHAIVATIPYRKFAACWRCREFNKALRIEQDPYALVPERYRTESYSISFKKSEVSEDDLLIG